MLGLLLVSIIFIIGHDISFTRYNKELEVPDICDNVSFPKLLLENMRFYPTNIGIIDAISFLIMVPLSY